MIRLQASAACITHAHLLDLGAAAEICRDPACELVGVHAPGEQSVDTTWLGNSARAAQSVGARDALYVDCCAESKDCVGAPG